MNGDKTVAPQKLDANWLIKNPNLYKKFSFMRAIPWFVDDSVDFLSNFSTAFQDKNGELPSVLEFGIGAGTLFFSSHSSRVVSIEHDESWYNTVSKIAADNELTNLQLLLRERPYASSLDFLNNSKFDIISIDGRDRVSCLERCISLSLLAENGVYILDNTERISGYQNRYADMISLLEGQYAMIHFEQSGIDKTGWLAPHRWITTVAFRKDGIQYTTKGVAL